MNTELLFLALQAALYGLSGVFIVLILFYVIVKVMIAMANRQPKIKED